jgi:hypothetical protein
VFRDLCRIGRRLVQLHLDHPRARLTALPECHGPLPKELGPESPRYAAGHIFWDQRFRLGPVPEDVWEFRIGGYQVCRKWLRDRHDLPLKPQHVVQYQRIVAALQATSRAMQRIDAVIDRAGGWDAVFADRR